METVVSAQYGLYEGKQYSIVNGSAYDRGAADSYYGRAKDPHCYPNGTYMGERVVELTAEQFEAYNAGYEWNERFGEKK